jgi:hypothetical protein
MSAAFNALPDTPLAMSTVDALDAHPSIVLCEAVLGERPNPQETIIAVMLATDETNHFLSTRMTAGPEWR